MLSDKQQEIKKLFRLENNLIPKMEGSALPNAVLQDLQDKLELLEEKATYVKQLMEKAVDLSVLTFETSQQDNVTNQSDAVRTQGVENQVGKPLEKEPNVSPTEIELLQQKEQLLYAVMGCITDLGNIDMTLAHVGKIHNLKVLTNTNIDNLENCTKQGGNEATGYQNAGAPEKVKLNAEITTFEQSLAGLEVLLQETLKLRSDVKDATNIPQKNPNTVEAAEILQMPKEPVLQNTINVSSSSSNPTDDEHLVSKLQEQIQELQNTIEQLEGAVDGERHSKNQ